MAGGRPPEYHADKIAKEVAHYIELCHEKQYLPTIEGLAVHLCVARSTLYEWSNTYPEFSDIFEQLKAAQASQLIQNGLAGSYNPTITKLMLTKHDYVEKQELTGKDGKDLIPSDVSQMTNEQLLSIVEGRGTEGKS